MSTDIGVMSAPSARMLLAPGPEHDGSAVRPSTRFTITGGIGGTRAHIEDLERAAAALERTALALDEAAEQVRRLLGLADQAAPWSPQTTPWARDALAPLCSPRSGVGARAERARATAASLRATATLYLETDQAVSAGLRSGLVAAGHRLGEAGPFAWLGLGVVAVAGGLRAAVSVLTLRALRQTPTPLGLLLRAIDSRAEALRGADGPRGFIARTLGGPGLLPEGLGWPTGDTVELVTPGLAAAMLSARPGRQQLRTDPVPAAAALLGRFAHLGTMVRGTHGLVVAPLVTAAGPGPWSAERNPAPPRDAEDVLGQIETLYPAVTPADAGPAGGSPGTVGVQCLDHPDGTRSWVVTIPGTQDWSPLAGPNPMDLRTNLDIIAGRPNDVSELVAEAMRSAGIAPGEPIVLAGHSQGGMVAMQVAQDPVLQREFSVTAVLTAGSPVGIPAGDLPPGVLTLHLENSADLVWAVDGAANPDDPQRTTVRADLAASRHAADRTAALTPLAAHDVAAYGRMASDVSAVGDPSVEAFDARLDSVFGGPGTTASTRFYTGVRVP